MVRSIGAVLAGFVLIGALSFGADLALRTLTPESFGADGRVESIGPLLFMRLYVGLFAVGGCYLAARLAGQKPMRHALILGLLGLLFNIAGSIAMWDTAPVWYHVLALALVMPYAWAGGRLRERELERFAISLA